MQTCSVISVLMSRVKGRPHQGQEPEKHSVERKPPPTPPILDWVMVWSNYHYFCVNFVVKKTEHINNILTFSNLDLGCFLGKKWQRK